jgi:XTP/dITP diphosphohydrolase
MRVFFVTRNRGKYESVKRRLERFGIEVVHVEKEVEEKRGESVVEVAVDKVVKAYEITKKPTIAIDAGLFIPSLNGFPGVYTAYVVKTIGIEGVLKLLEGKRRECYFETCLAYFDGSMKRPAVFTHRINGIIAFRPRGTLRKWSWSVLHLIFIPEGFSKTLAEMSFEEFESVVTRNSCYERFARWLKDKKLFNF